MRSALDLLAVALAKWSSVPPPALLNSGVIIEKRTDPHDLLAPIYGWFTEGFNAPDLKEAKALLDGLTP